MILLNKYKTNINPNQKNTYTFLKQKKLVNLTIFLDYQRVIMRFYFKREFSLRINIVR